MLRTFVVAAVAVTLWTEASGHMIIADTREFIEEIMQQDVHWAPYLNVNVKVNMTMLTIAARNVLASVAKTKKPQAVPGDTDAEPEPEPEPEDGIAIVNVLHAIAEVVSTHFEEGDALDFGMSLIASAVKCSVLKNIALQLRALSVQLPDSLHAYPSWMSDVWKNLIQYIIKLSQVKESLEFEALIYRSWMNTLWESTPLQVDTDDVRLLPVVVGDMSLTRDLVNESMTSTCELCTADAVAADEQFDPTAVDWTTHDSISRIMSKSQERLERIFHDLTFRSMNIDQWFDIFNITEIRERIVDHHVERERKRVADDTVSQKQVSGHDEEWEMVEKPTEA